MRRNIRIESNINNLRVVENAIDTFTNEACISQDSYGKILVSTLEAVNNAIIHGNKSDIKKYVQIEFKLENSDLEVKVTDEGKGFKPSEIPDPTRPENIESLDGRGVFPEGGPYAARIRRPRNRAQRGAAYAYHLALVGDKVMIEYERKGKIDLAELRPYFSRQRRLLPEVGFQ